MRSADQETPARSRFAKWRFVMDVLTTIAMLGAALVIIVPRFSGRGVTPSSSAPSSGVAPPSRSVSLQSAARRGNEDARVALLVFSDFQCPFCAKFARETLPTLEAKYVRTGSVLVAFRHLPLDMHPHAKAAAEAAECAKRQGKFWQYHDALFAQPDRLSAADLTAAARQIGLDPGAFEACTSGRSMASIVKSDLEDARALGINFTPVVMIGRLDGTQLQVTDVISGAQSFEHFSGPLDRVLAKIH
jgi:protein-disulfide isomerase